MELLALAGLEHYVDPVWVPEPSQTALAIETVANAGTLAELRGDPPSRLSSGQGGVTFARDLLKEKSVQSCARLVGATDGAVAANGPKTRSHRTIRIPCFCDASGCLSRGSKIKLIDLEKDYKTGL